MGLKRIDVETLRSHLDRQRVLQAVREGLIWHAQGKVQSPMPGQLQFASRGDCHIKFGHLHNASTFTIKIATGFYDNPTRGLPVNSGLVLVFDAQTGKPCVLFEDDGWLTAWRTAAAAALAAATLTPPQPYQIGIAGTGLQARLAVEWLPETVGDRPICLWGRNFDTARELAAALSSAARPVRAVPRIEHLLEECRLIVAATASTAPLFKAELVRGGTHVIALGADAPGKQELPVDLFRYAAHVFTDDHAQCLHHGELGHAVRAGVVSENVDVLLGAALSFGASSARAPQDISVVDLTGIAAEDIAIAGLFTELLAERLQIAS